MFLKMSKNENLSMFLKKNLKKGEKSKIEKGGKSKKKRKLEKSKPIIYLIANNGI